MNTVIAGARPEYLPMILALAASKDSVRGSTSSSGSAVAIVNDPIRSEIGMNCGIGLRETFLREQVRDTPLGTDQITAPCLLLDPITARQFVVRGGFKRKADLIRWL